MIEIIAFIFISLIVLSPTGHWPLATLITDY
jgi:hypothetical protein